jgi:SWIM zinc finger
MELRRPCAADVVAKKSPKRLVRLLAPPTPEEPGVLCITTGKTPTHYVFQEIPCEIGGRAFAMHSLGMGVLYHVRIGSGSDCSCECLGFLRHGRCKHVLALRALMDSDRI